MKHYNTENETIKACVAERGIRTLRGLLSRYMHRNNTKRYLNALTDIVASYNNSYHRSIKMTPEQVDESNKGWVFVNLYGEGFERGDDVRMAKVKGTFTPGYEPNWTGEIVYVKGENAKHPIRTYKVKDYAGDDILGTFYKQELQKVVPPTTWKVEKVLRTRRRLGRTEYLVKWENYPPSFNSWTFDLVDV
jgi:hypothetical protein